MKKWNAVFVGMFVTFVTLLGASSNAFAGQPGDVEIQVNTTANSPNQDITDDDLVSYGGSIECRARLTNNPAQSLSVTITATNDHLSFDHGTSIILPLDQTGAWTSFNIYGNGKSLSKNEVKLEAHNGGVNGDVLGDKGVTVYWLDGTMTVTAGSSYGVSNGVYRPVGGAAANFSATAALKPSGIDASKTDYATWQVGMLQNVEAYSGTVVWTDPDLVWDETYLYIPEGHTESAAKFFKTVSTGILGLDTKTLVFPLYDKPGTIVTIDENSLKPITTSNATATSNDSPRIEAPSREVFWLDHKIGDFSYKNVSSAKLDFDFRIWAVGYNRVVSDPPTAPAQVSIRALAETTWGVHVDSTTNGSKSIVTGTSGPPSTNATSGNTYPNNPPGETVGTETVTFTYHKPN